jgi:predicted ATPase
VLRGLYTHYHALAEHRTAYELAEQLLALAQEHRDPTFMLMAHQALGQSQADLGWLEFARDTLERGLAYHDPERYRSLAYAYGEEHGISLRVNLAVALLALGYPDQALTVGHEALAMAEALAHPHVLAYTLNVVSTLRLLRRESQVSQAVAERGISLCHEKGIPFSMATMRINHGHALAMQGRAAEGIAEALQGLAVYRSIGAGVYQTGYLGCLAEMYLVAGQVDAGLEAVGEGLEAVRETGERVMEAELYRLRAELLRRQGRDIQAEADLHQALAIAREQQARWWELRATSSLCRLWRDQDKRGGAHGMLAELYNWFTEGFDTLDLQEAGALLEELADS